MVHILAFLALVMVSSLAGFTLAQDDKAKEEGKGQSRPGGKGTSTRPRGGS